MAFSPRKFFGTLANPQVIPQAAPASDGSVSLYPLVETPESSWVVSFEFVLRGEKAGLQITFKDGVRCFYPGTEPWHYQSLARAVSKGQWIHKHIFTKKYELV